ncbi:hypothetical protein VNI00_019472 [Paramarasmius palmivorus]|uniref:Non-specific serine/threonine protein kinase n=1 Tax=Paramarasmius palmivorus TaxID=297713 RepID=A0AAW0ANE8_9AGAR
MTVYVPSTYRETRQSWPQGITFSEPPTAPDYFKCLGAFGESKSLIHANSSWEICEVIAHAAVGTASTSSLYSNEPLVDTRMLHRDVSIRNILCLKRPRTMKPFKISIPTCDDPMDMDSELALASDMQKTPIDGNELIVEVVEENLKGALLEPASRLPPTAPNTSSQGAAAVAERIKWACPKMLEYAQRVEEALLRLGATDQGSGILTDGDMAVEWKFYFDNAHASHTKSRAPEFMSIDLHCAMENANPYLQSPVDDLHSFFWVAMWGSYVQLKEYSAVEA